MLPLLVKAMLISTIIYAPCPAPDIRVCAVAPATIYLSDNPADRLPGDLNHELAHVYDFNFMTDQERGTFEYLTHHHRPWGQGVNNSGEQFAEAVRLCAHSTRWPGWAGYNYNPSVRTHRRICRWMATIGK